MAGKCIYMNITKRYRLSYRRHVENVVSPIIIYSTSRNSAYKAAKAIVVYVYCVNFAKAGRRQEELAALGLRTFTAGDEGSTSEATEPENSTEHSIATSAVAVAAPSLVTVGPGLPALPKKRVEKIASGVYVDFTELPPAKGKRRATPQVTEGQVLIMQASDMVTNKKAIPDLATWFQCFGLYVAVI